MFAPAADAAQCNEFSEESRQPAPADQDNRGEVVAVGGYGLDYDRTKFCEKDVQQRYAFVYLFFSFTY